MTGSDRNLSSPGTGPRRSLRELLPPYALACLGFIVATQLAVFYATRPALAGRTLHDLTTALDDAIPFSPWWVIGYFLVFPSWAVSFVLIMAEGKERAYRFTAAFTMAQLIAGTAFLVFPCTIERPALTGDGTAMALMRMLYAVDTPLNLFPSFHVLFSYFSWRGTMGCRKLPGWFGASNLGFLILACLSILFVKQHALADVPAALAVGEFSLQLARRARLERVVSAVERKIQTGSDKT